MATTLLDLPPELVVNIFSYLKDAAFFAGRQANKHLERASFSLFGKRFFRKKGYMITSASLDVLQSVASHKELRLYVQHVWFNPDCYTFGPPLYIPGFFDDTDKENAEKRQRDRYSDDPETNRRNHEAHAECVTDHSNLLHSNTMLANRLTTAFFDLPNLKTVGMRRSDEYSPWGWSRLKDAVGRDPRELGDIPWIPSEEASGSTLLYAALMKSLDTSGAQIRRLYTDAVEIDAISQHSLPADVIERACNSLLYLEINVTKGNHITTRSLFLEDVEPTPGSGLINLLSACPNLRELGLMIFPDRKQSHLTAPEEGWSQSYPYQTLSRLAQTVQLPNLRRIKLEKFTTTPSTLISLLAPSSQNLTSLKLRDIRLLDSPEGADNQKPWQAIFAFLASSCPKLSYLLLYHLSHATGGIRFVQNLPGPPPQNTDDPSVVTSTGYFTDFENISVEVGTAHNDPQTEPAERRAVISRAREAVGERVRALVEGHWYGRNTFSYEMDEVVWHTDTSEEEW